MLAPNPERLAHADIVGTFAVIEATDCLVIAVELYQRRRPPSRETLKQRRRRARRHAGLRMYSVELPENALAEMLIDTARIAAEASEDQAEVEEALTSYLLDVLRRWRR